MSLFLCLSNTGLDGNKVFGDMPWRHECEIANNIRRSKKLVCLSARRFGKLEELELCAVRVLRTRTKRCVFFDSERGFRIFLHTGR